MVYILFKAYRVWKLLMRNCSVSDVLWNWRPCFHKLMFNGVYFFKNPVTPHYMQNQRVPVIFAVMFSPFMEDFHYVIHYINSRHRWSVLTMEKSLSGLQMCKFWCQPHKDCVRSEFNKVVPVTVLLHFNQF